MTIDFDAPDRSVPHHIQASWKRCQSMGLNPTSLDKDHIIGEFELSEYYDRYAELLYYSTPILEDVYGCIRGSDFLLVIASPEGYIINTLGDPSFLRHVDNVALRKGANWLEDYKGTNAVGTALVEKKTVLVHGSQHFLQDNHFLTCAATPIYQPDGQLLGVLNVSSYHQNYHPLTLGLVKRAAHSIEQALILAHDQRSSNKRTIDLNYIYQHHPSSLITINKEGKITRLNNEAARTIGCSGQTVIGQPISQVISGLTYMDEKDVVKQQISFKNKVFTPHLLPNENHDEEYILLRGETQKPRSELTNRYQFSDILSNDPQLNELIAVAKRAAQLPLSLLITGESGTGKELFAQSIHGASGRSDKPFVAINCSAIPESLLESELFGYEKGAFTGAKANGQSGKFEAADGGTLFLDEIGDMPLAAQASLLRVLQEKCVTRIGGVTPRAIDVRIIAATHKDLQKEIEAGRFRADLYFRLSGFTLKLPSLRNRTDVLMLADHILASLPFTSMKPTLAEDAKQFIREYDWPGNFRQLQNMLQQAAFLADYQPITKSLLLSLGNSTFTTVETQHQPTELTSMREHEITLIKQALKQTNGNISHAARQLNIGRNTLYRKMKAYNLSS